MGLTTYVMILFGIAVAFFLTGSSPMIFSMFNCDQTVQTCAWGSDGTSAGQSVLNTLITTLANPSTLIFLAGISLTGLITGGSFGVVYILPALMISAFANLFFLPTDFLLNEAVPFEVRMVVFGFMQIFLILTIVSFVRGGE